MFIDVTRWTRFSGTFRVVLPDVGRRQLAVLTGGSPGPLDGGGANFGSENPGLSEVNLASPDVAIRVAKGHP